MRLDTLLDSVNIKDFAGPEDQVINAIHYDSREMKAGGLFVAIHGLQCDGHGFIDDAVERGAAAIVTEKAWSGPPSVSVIQVDNARRTLAALSSFFYGDPSRELFVIGVTGTNGKTTTSYLVESILRAAGFNVGVVGTINYRFGDQTFVNSVTTPESRDLMFMLRQMADNGVTHVVMEVSSHALDLNRVAFCEFDVGVFTNLSRDHLDYHGSMEAYWHCKRRLCLEYLGLGPKQVQPVAVVNWDDPQGRELVSEISVRSLRAGLSKECEIRAEDIKIRGSGISGRVMTLKGSFRFVSPLVGRHNIYNILTATGVAAALGLPESTMKAGIEGLHAIPGRLEPVATGRGFSVFVDYAHTPDALEKVLATLRAITPGRLITVFGCGGDRDRYKRPLMGAGAGCLSDLSVLTSDNPRSEAPEAILADITAGIAAVRKRRYEISELSEGFESPGYAVEPDRKRAIAVAIGAARKGDTILLAGKGHETYQLMGEKTVPFDDRIEVRRVLDRLTPLAERKGPATEK
jgi:UDP-N-acetylmuramyl-tripeptide synthetase